MTPVQLNRHHDAPVFRHMRAVHKWVPCEDCVDLFIRSMEARDQKIDELLAEIYLLKNKT